MIGYEMGSSPTNVYTYNQDFSNERFKHEWQMHIGINLTTFFAEKFSSKVKFLGQSQTLTQELDLFETPTRELFFYSLLLSTLSTTTTITSNNKPLDWNSSTTGALVHFFFFTVV